MARAEVHVKLTEVDEVKNLLAAAAERIKQLEAAISSVRALLEERRAGKFWYVRVADVLAALDSSGTVEDAPESAPRPVEGGHVWSPPGDVQQCVNCHQTRGAYFATSTRRPCPRPPSAQLPEERSDEIVGYERIETPDGERIVYHAADAAPERSDEEPEKPPACDCGHEFDPDPFGFHLGHCAYRDSFYRPGGRQARYDILRSVSGLPVDGETT